MKLYNTLTRQKEEFKSLVPGEVKMYSCGPTVYNYFHLGNARPFIVFDCLRQFEYRGYNVNFVQNFTDVDDKLINKSREEGCTVGEIAEKYIKEYFTDAQALGIKEATVHPRATENIDAIIETVQTLIDKGHAYEVEGDVYFSVESYKDYGKLSHQPLEDLESGVRKELDDKKHHPMDFALWKKRKTEDEIGWDSPWGIGRPGWHIECTAMVNRYLGTTIDIHSGGFDLIFPHHENEIAQSVCANGTPFANYWLHNGFINVNNEKMSKSLGNFFTVRDIAAKYDYEVIRFFMLSAHYRSPINFCDELMDAAKNGLERIYNCIDNLEFAIGNATSGDVKDEVKNTMDGYREKFILAMEDDLNTADAISVIFEAVRFANSLKDSSKEELELVKATILELGNVLGLLKNTEKASLDEEIEALIAQRTEARKNKDWGLADKIRDDLKARGIVLEDTPDGVKWKYEK